MYAKVAACSNGLLGESGSHSKNSWISSSFACMPKLDSTPMVWCSSFSVRKRTGVEAGHSDRDNSNDRVVMDILGRVLIVWFFIKLVDQN